MQELQLSLKRQQDWQPNWSASTPMHTAGRSLTIASLRSCGGLQLTRCLLEIQQSREETVLRVCGWQLPDTDSEGDSREGIPLDLLFASREELVGDAGSCLGHHNHKITVFDSWRSKEGMPAELPPWTSGGRLWLVWEAGWWSPLGGSPEGQRSLGRLDVL